MLKQIAAAMMQAIAATIRNLLMLRKGNELTYDTSEQNGFNLLAVPGTNIVFSRSAPSIG
jgi:hypothetical protein